MSDTVRGLVLLVSLLLWLPVLRPLLAGELGTVQAVVRYAGALALAWGGASLLSKVVAGYTPDPEEAAEDNSEPTGEPAGRRQDDVSS